MTIQKDNITLEMPTCADRLIWDVWTSRFHYPTLTVADELNLFSILANKPSTLEEVSKTLSLGLRGVEALLGVLTSLGFLVQHQQRFFISEVTRNFLLPESPYYWGGVLHRNRDYSLHSIIREALEKDKANITQASQDGYIRPSDQWETGEIDLNQARALTKLMHSHSFPEAMGVARHGSFSGVQRLLDVGGGSACFCIALALRYPTLRSTIMELPVVCTLAEEYIAEYSLQDHIDTIAVDMFKDPWPSGYDAIFFSNIFHDWEQKQCLYLAQSSYNALPPKGRIYLHEMLLESTKDGPVTATSFSMSMLCDSKGKQFTANELDELLRKAGFDEVEVIPTYSYYSLISAKKR